MNDRPAPKRAIELRLSIDQAAQYVSNVYVTYLLVAIYISIAIGSTTDQQLLLDSDIPLPLLTVGLPVRGFYIVVPVAFVLLHLYVLLQVYFLSAKQAEFEECLQTLPTPRERQQQRILLFPFVISPHSIQASDSPVVRWILSLVVWSTVLVIPPLILGFTLVRFLPYHSTVITWWHRTLLLIDIAVLVVLWTLILRCRPRTKKDSSRRLVTILRRSGIGAVYFTIIVFLSLSLVIMSIPGEPLDRATYFLNHFKDSLHRNLVVRSTTIVREAPPSQLIAVYLQQRKTENDAWRKHAKGVDLQERDLRGADFSYSNFYNANLQGANLDFATLSRANFQGASLQPFTKPDGTEISTSLRGVDLSYADLRAADLSKAELQGADISYANMEGTNLSSTKLSGVRQSKLDEWSTGVFSVKLQGARLSNAELMDADLRWADLRGAELLFSDLRGANLHGANLTGAALIGTKLLGAELKAAILDLCELWAVKIGLLMPTDLVEIRERIERSSAGFPPLTVFPTIPAAGSNTTLDSPITLHALNAFYDDDFRKFAGHPVSLTEEQYLEHLIPFLVDLACRDGFSASAMAYRSVDHLAIEAVETADTGEPYYLVERQHFSSRLANAMLQSEVKGNCIGMTDLSPSFHEGLELVAKGLRADVEERK